MGSFPLRIRAGVQTTVEVPSDTVTFRANKAGTIITKTANADSEIVFLATDTITAGDYLYQLLDSDLEVVESGVIKFLPSLAAGDPRSWAAITLAAIEAVLTSRATQTQRNVTVGDKTLGYMSHDELLRAREYFLDLVNQENAEESGISDQTYVVEFRRP